MKRDVNQRVLRAEFAQLWAEHLTLCGGCQTFARRHAETAPQYRVTYPDRGVLGGLSFPLAKAIAETAAAHGITAVIERV